MLVVETITEKALYWGPFWIEIAANVVIGFATLSGLLSAIILVICAL